MTLYHYLMKNHLGEDSPEGDLAEDTQRMTKMGKLHPRQFARPYKTQCMRFLRFLQSQGACDGAMRAAIHVGLEYLAYDRYERTFRFNPHFS